MDIIDRVVSTVDKHALLARGQSVLIGLSGGPDSVCLASILSKLRPSLDLNLNAMYIDHGLRPLETPKEAEFCAGLCEKLDMGFSTSNIGVREYADENRMNLQEAARKLRYDELNANSMRLGADAIAVAHNLDDQIETFFMRLIRGSGPHGLIGIPYKRGRIIRPLLDAPRSDIEDYIKREGLGHVIDSSNLKDDYLRNRLRSTLMPVLTEMNPNLSETLSHTMQVLAGENRFIEAAATKATMRLITDKTDKRIELFLSPLSAMDIVILRRVLRRAIAETHGLRGIGFVHIEEIIDLIKTGLPGDRVSLPHDIRAVKKYSTLLITSEPSMKLGTYKIEPAGLVHMAECGMSIRANLTDGAPESLQGTDAALFDADKVSLPMIIRPRREGDFFHPSGMKGTKKLQDYFVDLKIPRDERDSIAVVTTSKDEIIWIAGLRQDERFLADENTGRFLLLEVLRA